MPQIVANNGAVMMAAQAGRRARNSNASERRNIALSSNQINKLSSDRAHEASRLAQLGLVAEGKYGSDFSMTNWMPVRPMEKQPRASNQPLLQIPKTPTKPGAVAEAPVAEAPSQETPEQIPEQVAEAPSKRPGAEQKSIAYDQNRNYELGHSGKGNEQEFDTWVNENMQGIERALSQGKMPNLEAYGQTDATRFKPESLQAYKETYPDEFKEGSELWQKHGGNEDLMAQELLGLNRADTMAQTMLNNPTLQQMAKRYGVNLEDMVTKSYTHGDQAYNEAQRTAGFKTNLDYIDETTIDKSEFDIRNPAPSFPSGDSRAQYYESMFGKEEMSPNYMVGATIMSPNGGVENDPLLVDKPNWLERLGSRVQGLGRKRANKIEHSVNDWVDGKKAQDLQTRKRKPKDRGRR